MNEPVPALGNPIPGDLADRLRGEEGIDAAYILGSAAGGRLRADSDVDIAILPAKGALFDGMRVAGLAADLGEICGRPVDLGILHTGNLVYAKEAVANGRVLFERDGTARARFEMHALSMYAGLQENRRAIIHAYAA